MKIRNIAMACGALGCAALPAHAAFVVEPSARLQVEFEDNVRLDELEDDAVVTSLTAQLSLRQVTERSSFAAVGGLSYLNYSGVDGLEDQEVGFINLFGTQQSERANYGVRLNLRRDVILRHIGGILPDFDATTPDPALGEGDPLEDLTTEETDIDESVLRQQVERDFLRLQPFFGYDLTERTEGRVGYVYRGQRYDDESEAFGLRDSDSHSVYTEVWREVSPRDRANVRLQATRFEPDDSVESENYEATLGWRRQATEQFSFGVDLGARRVESDRNSDNGFLYRLEGTYRTELARFIASVERSVLPSAFGDIVEADRLNLTYRRQLSERWEFGLRSRAYEVQRDGRGGRDRSFFSAQPFLNWALSPAWNIGVSYTYRWTDRVEDGDSVSGNTASMSLTYQPPSRL